MVVGEAAGADVEPHALLSTRRSSSTWYLALHVRPPRSTLTSRYAMRGAPFWGLPKFQDLAMADSMRCR